MAINLFSYTNNMTTGYFSSTNNNILYIIGYSGYITGVGNVGINWSGFSGVYYNTGFKNFDINKKILVVLPNNQTMISGDSLPSFTVNISGFVYGQSSGNITTLPIGYTTATIDSPTGTYPILASGGSGINYNFDYKTGYLTITPDNTITNYVSAVELADGQALESSVISGITSFVTGCKADGIWSSIKSCCILGAARSITGALVPLKGPAPFRDGEAGNIFAPSSYLRKSGIKGSGGSSPSRWLNTNRASNQDPADSKHISIFITEAPSGNLSQHNFFGANSFPVTGAGISLDYRFFNNGFFFDNNGGGSRTSIAIDRITGFYGVSRSNSTNLSFILGTGFTGTISSSISANPRLGINDTIFKINSLTAGNAGNTNARISFYSVGSGIDLNKLNLRVSGLMSDLNQYIT